MPFDWQDYLRLARHLLDAPDDWECPEAALRTTASRAYYAAFGYAMDYACDYLGFEPRYREEDKSQDHGRLRDWFKRSRRANVANMLEDLRRWRNDSDYIADLGDTDFTEMAGNAVERAELLFQAIPPPPPTD